MSTHSMTCLFSALRSGDPGAAQVVWERYLRQLLALIQSRLAARGQAPNDAEDIASDAFFALFQGIRWDRFSKLDDRDDLWQLLVVLAGRRLDDRARRALAKKRGAGQVRGESVFVDLSADGSPRGLEQIAEAQPTPEEAVEVAEQLAHLLSRLTDETQRQIALLRLENLTNQEIAERLGTSLRSVERKLGLIRRIWREEFPE